MFFNQSFLLKRFIITLLILFCFPYNLRAQEASVIQEIKKTGLLKIAVREDAVPFGYRDLNNNWTGI